MQNICRVEMWHFTEVSINNNSYTQSIFMALIILTCQLEKSFFKIDVTIKAFILLVNDSYLYSFNPPAKMTNIFTPILVFYWLASKSKLSCYHVYAVISVAAKVSKYNLIYEF